MNAVNNRFKPLFILSTGRSGSTLLQRYLNASKDLVIWGEHGGFITGFSRTYYNFIGNKDVQKLLLTGMKHTDLLLNSEATVQVDIEWTNNFTRENFLMAFRNMLLEIFTINIPPTIRWGFKEIRYKEDEIKFLKELFPEAQFVFILRNPIDTLSSSIAAWEKDTDIWTGKKWRIDNNILEYTQGVIAKHSRRILEIAETMQRFRLEDNCYLVRYEDLLENTSLILHELCSFLNISPPSEDKVSLIGLNVRAATNKEDITAALYSDFYNTDHLLKLRSLFGSFGY